MSIGFAFIAGMVATPLLCVGLFWLLLTYAQALRWYRQPLRRWTNHARLAGSALAIAEYASTDWVYTANKERAQARRWRLWCRWWPSARQVWE
jgi:hypothetical protein